MAEARLNLGFALEKQGALAEAESAYFCAMALDPDLPEVYVDLCALLLRRKRLEEALEVGRTGLLAFPDSPALWGNLGSVLACMQLEGEAEEALRKALSLDPEQHRARYTLSYLLLRQGRFEEGWQAVESRARSLELRASIPEQMWQGQCLDGRSLIIAIEAGCGDLIQYARYVPYLKAKGAGRLGIVCHPPLRRLFTSLDGVDRVLVLDEEVSPADWDYWTLPMSLPGLCGTRLESIPAPIPYLHALPEQVEAWRARLPEGGLRVGLAWKGNPLCENDTDRSLAHLGVLAPLGTLEGVRLISLQKGPGEKEAGRAPAGMDIFDAAPFIQDYADTAALIASLDLVISVDTSVAHLAGALGRPCWTLLPHYKTDARWMTDREDSPWYPGTMRLFRQPPGGTWAPVIDTVTRELRRLPAPR